MQKVSYIFSYICCLLRQRLSKILIFRKKFRRGPNYCSDFFRNQFKFLEAQICRFFMLQLTWDTL